MSDRSVILNLPLIQPSQAQKHVTHNEALVQLDALVQLSVESRSRDVPPPDPLPGARYVVGPGAGEIWAGHADAVAVWDGTAWRYHVPRTGWQAWIRDEAIMAVYDGNGWVDLSGGGQNLAGVGINTSYDATNPLAVSGAATLLTHAGAGHQLKINKAAPGNTAALLFQSGWSGLAEIGLAGNDDFSVKVSADGSSFTEALRIDRGTGRTDARQLRSGAIDIAADTVGVIQTPAEGGILALAVVTPGASQPAHAGLFAYRTAGGLMLMRLAQGPSVENQGAVQLTGTTGSAGTSAIAAAPGQIHIENRNGATWRYAYTFLC